MDVLFDFLADRIAQQIKASREADAEQRRIADAIAAPLANERGAGRRPDAIGPVVRPPLVAKLPPAPRSFGAPSSRIVSSPAAQPAAVASPAERVRAARPTRVALDDAFPTTLETMPAARLEPANPLLRAFAGGNALLGALVLSEALAPPVALRGEPPHQR